MKLRVIQGGKGKYQGVENPPIYLDPAWVIEEPLYKQIDRVAAGLIGLDSLMKQLNPKTADRLVKYIKNNT